MGPEYASGSNVETIRSAFIFHCFCLLILFHFFIGGIYSTSFFKTHHRCRLLLLRLFDPVTLPWLPTRLSVCLSVNMAQLGSHWTNFHDIWYLNIFRKYVEIIQVSLQCGKKNVFFPWRPMCSYDNISLLHGHPLKLCCPDVLKSGRWSCISWCCKDTCKFVNVTGSRFADFSQSPIKTDPLHGMSAKDTLCILLGSKLINAWVCDTPETLRYWTSPENHSSSSVRVVFVQKKQLVQICWCQ